MFSSRLWHRILADTVFAIHGSVFFLVLGGAFYSIKHPWYLPWHVLTISVVTLHNMISKGCVLTWMEEGLRRKYNPHYTLNSNFFATYFSRITGIQISKEQGSSILNFGRILLVLVPVVVVIL
jgi:hypothetical protein